MAPQKAAPRRARRGAAAAVRRALAPPAAGPPAPPRPGARGARGGPSDLQVDAHQPGRALLIRPGHGVDALSVRGDVSHDLRPELEAVQLRAGAEVEPA